MNGPFASIQARWEWFGLVVLATRRGLSARLKLFLSVSAEWEIADPGEVKLSGFDISIIAYMYKR